MTVEDKRMGEKKIPADKWEWYGMAAHFICGDRCLHHLATKVGPYLVSTVGHYIPASSTEKRRSLEFAEEIGFGRKFETFVFKATKKLCECGCGLPVIDPREIDSLSANDHITADSNHMKMCRKYAALKDQS
jgi:hypothetical protein